MFLNRSRLIESLRKATLFSGKRGLFYSVLKLFKNTTLYLAKIFIQKTIDIHWQINKYAGLTDYLTMVLFQSMIA